MSLTAVASGAVINHGDVNQLINVLQQPSGGQEAGHYKLEFSAYTANAVISCNILTLSRGSTPVSLSVDTADDAAVNIGAPSTTHLTSGGARIKATATAAGNIAHEGGNYTMQY